MSKSEWFSATGFMSLIMDSLGMLEVWLTDFLKEFSKRCSIKNVRTLSICQGTWVLCSYHHPLRQWIVWSLLAESFWSYICTRPLINQWCHFQVTLGPTASGEQHFGSMPEACKGSGHMYWVSLLHVRSFERSASKIWSHHCHQDLAVCIVYYICFWGKGYNTCCIEVGNKKGWCHFFTLQVRPHMHCTCSTPTSGFTLVSSSQFWPWKRNQNEKVMLAIHKTKQNFQSTNKI